MAATGSEHLGQDIDLGRFCQAFFDEAGENLDSMEQMLLNLDLEHADDEQMNAIFRCTHSLKGGAATFGFADVAALAHEMETLLDQLRRRELLPTAAMIDMLLAAGDALRAMLARHQGQRTDPIDTAELLLAIRATALGSAPLATACGSAPSGMERGSAPGRLRQLELTAGPFDDPSQADRLVGVFESVSELGTLQPLDGGRAADGMRRFKLLTASSDETLLELLAFHVDLSLITLTELGAGYGFHAGAPGAPAVEAAEAAECWGFFDGAPGAPSASPAGAAPLAAPRGTESGTLRVSVDKVDQLINLVGELVVTQAMLARNSQTHQANPARQACGSQRQIDAGLADLERHTHELQQAVMSIRMVPMSIVFNRFPRMLRELAGKLGKRVELVLRGAATELDKGLVEKITDPLTHLVRNSCDHGIESPAERRAQGKPEHGTITLIAAQQGGSIVIEVRDDGQGLRRSKLIAKARERGLRASDSMSDAEVYGLIFAPGFSTAEQVTDVSGRGVGMDVVKANIASFGGTVEIDSAEGCGMSVRVRLPLTLAIMEGMSVRVGDECYLLPLASVVESLQVRDGMLQSLGGAGRVVQLRGEVLPVLDLEQVFRVPRFDFEHVARILVVAEAEGARVALLVDELLGQQQVVVKNLERNYRKVDDIAGATLLADGRVALILDVASLVRRARH